MINAIIYIDQENIIYIQFRFVILRIAYYTLFLESFLVEVDLNFDPDQVLVQFKQLECKKYPIESINILHEHPEIFEQKLLALLDEASSKIDDELLDEVDDRLIVALFTLAKYRSKEAYPKVITLLAQHTDDNDFLGDLLTESIPIILTACFNGDLSKAEELIFTKNIDCYARLAPILSLEYLVASKQIALSQALDFIEKIAEVIIDEGSEEGMEPGNILELMLNELASFSLPRYDNFIVKKKWKPQDGDFCFDLDRELEYLREKYPTESNSYNRSQEALAVQHFDRLMAEGVLSVTEWVGTREEMNDNKMDFRNWPIVKSVKIGRNDPCPCGSGKKYKKCCIA